MTAIGSDLLSTEPGSEQSGATGEIRSVTAAGPPPDNPHARTPRRGGPGDRVPEIPGGEGAAGSDLELVLAYLRAVAYRRLPRPLAARMVRKGEALLVATQAAEPGFIGAVAAHLRHEVPLRLSDAGASMQTMIESLLTDFEIACQFPRPLPERYDAADPGPQVPQRSLDLAELRHAISLALQSLDAREQEIIRHRYWEDLSYTQTGSSLGLGRSRTCEIAHGVLAKLALVIAGYRGDRPHRGV